MTHGLARSGGCSPDYPNDAKAVLERVTGGHAPFFDDGSPSAKSLDRRDLIQRALEIESLSLKMNKDWEGNDCLWPETLTDRYNELRKQAEAQQCPINPSAASAWHAAAHSTTAVACRFHPCPP